MEQKDRKIVMRKMSYGLYIITSQYNGIISAATVTWVTQISFEPLMILVCLNRQSSSYEVVNKKKEFLLHFLGCDQKQMAASFFKPSVIENSRLNGYQYDLFNDLPRLSETLADIECKVVKVVDFGDHPAFISEVKSTTLRSDLKPLDLNSTNWHYGG